MEKQKFSVTFTWENKTGKKLTLEETKKLMEIFVASAQGQNLIVREQ